MAMAKREEWTLMELSPQSLLSCRGSGEPKSYPRPSQSGEGPRGWAGLGWEIDAWRSSHPWRPREWSSKWLLLGTVKECDLLGPGDVPTKGK